MKEKPKNCHPLLCFAGQFKFLDSISVTSCHNSGANTTHRKIKIFFKISIELFLATDAGDFFNLKNRCTLVASDQTQKTVGPAVQHEILLTSLLTFYEEDMLPFQLR